MSVRITIRDRVFESLDTGFKNSPEIKEMTPLQLTCDLLDYDSYFDDDHIETILPYVTEWLNQRRTR